eukprot:5213827-Alexandrium_andersonii.AAC.1
MGLSSLALQPWRGVGSASSDVPVFAPRANCEATWAVSTFRLFRRSVNVSFYVRVHARVFSSG